MRKLSLGVVVGSIALLLSAQGFSCPNLAGHFQCNDFENGSVQDVVIEQTMVEGATSYTIIITTDEGTQTRNYIANGQTTVVMRDGFSERTETSFCQNDELRVRIEGTTTDSQSLDALVTIKTDADNNLYDSYAGSLGADEFFFDETCSRL